MIMRVIGFEPIITRWKRVSLPLTYTRKAIILFKICMSCIIEVFRFLGYLRFSKSFFEALG